MSDYTPNTKEVRYRYSEYETGEYGHAKKDRQKEQFDRWLAEHDRKLAERAFAEGDVARAEFVRAAYNAEVPTADALALVPKNPYTKATP